MATPLYNVGTATLTAGSTAMVGQGTLWLGNVRPGDQVVSYTGQTAIVGTVNSNTSITLLRAYRGTSQTAQAYEILYTPDDPFTQQLAREVLQGISASALVKLGGVTPAARKLVHFDAAANAALSDLSDFALSLLDEPDGAGIYGALGQIPNAQVRNDLTPDKAFRRGNILGTVSRSGSSPTGALIERGANSNGEYVRFADGTQICTLYADYAGIAAIDTPSGALFRSPVQVWSLPASFVSNPSFGGTVRRGSSDMLGVHGYTLNLGIISFSMWSSNSLSLGDQKQIALMAIGRWF